MRGQQPFNVLADDVVPATFSGALNLGQSVTINKIVTIKAGAPTSAKVDVFFLADTTSSMGGSISNIQAGANTIMSSVSTLGDVAFAVGEYRDWGQGDPYERIPLRPFISLPSFANEQRGPFIL